MVVWVGARGPSLQGHPLASLVCKTVAGVVTGAPCVQGQPFNSPNDVCVGADGSVWFTDPDAGAMQARALWCTGRAGLLSKGYLSGCRERRSCAERVFLVIYIAVKRDAKSCRKADAPGPSLVLHGRGSGTPRDCQKPCGATTRKSAP